jgi:broad specificity phosphatase PhoE
MGVMLTIHLVRHGDTAQAADGIFCGDLDPPLTDHGRSQAELVARALTPLRLVGLYCSPKLRARQTAEPLARNSGLEPVVADGLREIAYGTWEGRKESEIRQTEPTAYTAWHDDPGMVSPPGGETAFAIAARALPVIAAVRERYTTGNVVVVSHKATVRILVCALLGMPLKQFRTHVACPTTSVTSFDMAPGGPMLVRLADVHHLV